LLGRRGENSGRLARLRRWSGRDERRERVGHGEGVESGLRLRPMFPEKSRFAEEKVIGDKREG